MKAHLLFLFHNQDQNKPKRPQTVKELRNKNFFLILNFFIVWLKFNNENIKNNKKPK